MKMILSKSLLFIAVASLMAMTSGCGNNNSGLTFWNDMDVSTVWTEHPLPNLIVSEHAHSGRYVSRLNTSDQCSPTFYKRFNALGTKPFKKVTVEGWFYMNGSDCNPNLVVDLRDKDEKPTEYLTKDVKSVSNEVGKWINASFTVDLTEKNRNNPENYIRIYALNNLPVDILVDDLKITFE